MEHEWEETTYADSQAAVISAPAQLNRPVSTSESSTIDERKFFVGGIPADAWDRDLEDLFREFGDVDNVKIIVDPRTQRHRGFGFVEMKTAEAAASVLRQDRHSIRGRPVQVRRMEHEGVSLARKIFVGGINPVLEESTLESYFSRFGPVEQTTIVRDAVTGRAKGFGFVVFSTDEAARAVLQSRVHMVTANDKVDIRPAESRKKWDIGILEYSIQSRKGLGPARAYSTTHDVYYGYPYYYCPYPKEGQQTGHASYGSPPGTYPAGGMPVTGGQPYSSTQPSNTAGYSSAPPFNTAYGSVPPTSGYSQSPTYTSAEYAPYVAPYVPPNAYAPPSTYIAPNSGSSSLTPTASYDDGYAAYKTRNQRSNPY
ncbi:MAG: uncharacterized protein KVP18_004271 [Porospora cf. gigantea A]|uniref:uncharacterized protein n=1 Tax=Porospora cf. gigantea A TaxID=2853593 RepID=UPI00355A76F3|nr:MAG: hypothetical protein KVP18_004271 [Porospora cf. gigantea A]